MAFKGRLQQRLHEWRKLPKQLLAPKQDKQIIWVAGVQRSGTNMMMNAFDNHPLTFVYHESDSRAFVQYSLKPIASLELAFKRRYAPYIVSKALLDADRLIELMEHFPTSKGIWPMRNFYDVINSHMVLWPNFREQIDEIATGKTVTKWRGRNITDETRAKVSALYRPEITIPDCKALFWYLRNDYVFQHNLEKNDRILMIRYEDFVQNPAAGAKRLADFSEMPYTEAMIDGVHTRSIKKAKQIKLDPAIEKACLDMEKRLIENCITF